MKKIPSLFVRDFVGHRKFVKNELTSPELQKVLEGKCLPTLKMDGSACASLGGVFYKRYDAKKGKTPPERAIPCGEPDLVTGHWPHWVPVSEEDKGDKWFVAAKNNYMKGKYKLKEGTYEAIGLHFRDNPYCMSEDTLYKHGSVVLNDLKDCSFEGIKAYLRENVIEGIVFWDKGEPLCKIKRSDYGIVWSLSKARK